MLVCFLCWYVHADMTWHISCTGFYLSLFPVDGATPAGADVLHGL